MQSPFEECDAMRFLLLLIVTVGFATMLSCRSPEPGPEPEPEQAVATDESPEQLMARGWKLTSITGAGIELALTQEIEITLVFTPDGRIAGSGGCNRYFSGVELGAPGELSLGPVGSTMMACSELTMAQEQQYLQALQSAGRYRLAGDRLELLFGEDGVLTFEATELPES
jgi:heat shock protein HslJ